MELARWRLVVGLIHLMIAIVCLILMNHWGMLKDVVSVVLGLGYLSCGTIPGLLPLLLPLLPVDPWYSYWIRLISGGQEVRQLAMRLCLCLLSCTQRLMILSKIWDEQSWTFHSFGNDGWERLCYSVLQACPWVMMLLTFLETLVDFLMYVDPWGSGLVMAVPVGNREVAVPFEPLARVMIRWGRVLGDFNELVAWRIGLGTMGATLLTLVLGAYGSVMTANVFWICLGLAFLEMILVSASQQKILNMCLQIRYIFVSIGKILLAGCLIVDNYVLSSTKSSGCKEGSACYSRLRECFWVMLVFYFLELLIALLLLYVENPRQDDGSPSKKIRGRANRLANFYGLILTMSNAFSMAEVAVVGLLLSGSYGFMTAKGFWLCGTTLFIELATLMCVTDHVAKVIKNELDNRISLPRGRWPFIIVVLLRFIGLSIIAPMLRDGRNPIGEKFLSIIAPMLRDARNPIGEKFFIANMSNCDETCKARGRDLIAICGSIAVLQISSSFYLLYLLLPWN